MKRKILTNSVTVTGPSFLGHKSSIIFEPAGKPGWYLRTKKADVPIDFRIAHAKLGRLQLSKYGTELNVYEHIGALRTLLGIDQVILVVHNAWPPYLGGAGAYEKQLRGSWVQTDEDFPAIYPIRRASHTLSTHGVEVDVSIKLSEVLKMEIHSEWKPLPRYGRKLMEEDLADSDLLEKILQAKPQGFPFTRKRWALYAQRIIGWPNMQYISWADEFEEPSHAAFAWWAHAAQDAYGEISLCDAIAMPVMSYYRNCGGHSSSLKVIKNAYGFDYE